MQKKPEQPINLYFSPEAEVSFTNETVNNLQQSKVAKAVMNVGNILSANQVRIILPVYTGK